MGPFFPGGRWTPVLLFFALLLAAPLSGDAAVLSVIDSASAPPDVSAGARVLCPAGTVTVGGGVDADLLALVTSSFPVHADGTPDGGRLLGQPDGAGPGPLGWQASMRHAGLGAATVKIAALCSDAGSTSTEVASALVNPSFAVAALALCPPGRKAIGGGVDLEQPATMNVTSDGPLVELEQIEATGTFFFAPDGIHAGPVGWFAAARSDDAQARQMKVGAICSARFPVQTVIDSVTVPAGGQDSLRVLCPGGLRASAGGIALENALNMQVTASGPHFALRSGAQVDLGEMDDGAAPGPIGWAASAHNIGVVPLMMKVAAICVPEPSAATQGLAVVGVLGLLSRRRGSGRRGRNGFLVSARAAGQPRGALLPRRASSRRARAVRARWPVAPGLDCLSD